MQNPWNKLPTSPPYLLEIDKISIDNHQTKFNENTALHFELLPEPFLGNPNATVILLNLNPGYSPDDITYHQQQKFIDLSLANLKHQSLEYPFFLLDPSLSAPGRIWWEKKLKAIIQDTDKQTVANQVLCVEYFPYHSRRFGHHKMMLPSQEYSFHLVREAIARRVIIVLMRSKKLWLSAVSELEEYELLFSLRNVQNPTISPGNCPERYASIVRALK
jgi:hypothetical protein